MTTRRAMRRIGSDPDTHDRVAPSVTTGGHATETAFPQLASRGATRGEQLNFHFHLPIIGSVWSDNQNGKKATVRRLFSNGPLVFVEYEYSNGKYNLLLARFLDAFDPTPSTTTPFSEANASRNRASAQHDSSSESDRVHLEPIEKGVEDGRK